MDKIKDHFGYFRKQHPEIYAAYENYGKMIHEHGGPLDEKTRALLKIAISATGDRNYALETHMKKAIQAGCTKEEIEHVILLTSPSMGFPSMMESLLVFRSVFEEKE